jgi:hypothetical protein
MPKIQWTNLSAALRKHLFDRLEDRQITVEDLYLLKMWRESEPEAPKVNGTRISGHSRFAVKTISPRRFS